LFYLIFELFNFTFGQLPPHYVVDIGLEKTKGPIVVEINGISEAGNTNKQVFEKVLNAYMK
jgi:hypothetical protein